jgi:hypothetical protein
MQFTHAMESQPTQVSRFTTFQSCIEASVVRRASSPVPSVLQPKDASMA